MNAEIRNRYVTWGILVILGLGLIALFFVEGLGWGVLYYLIGGALVAGHLFQWPFSAFVIGCILLGLGLAQLGEGPEGWIALEGLSPTGLGVGYLAIFLIDLVTRGRTPWVMLLVGAIFAISGLATIDGLLQRFLSEGWPMALVLAGLLILVGMFGLGGRDPEPEGAKDLPMEEESGLTVRGYGLPDAPGKDGTEA